MRPGLGRKTTPNPRLEPIFENKGWGSLPIISSLLANGEGEPINTCSKHSKRALYNLKRDHGILLRIDSNRELWFVVPDGTKPTSGMLGQMNFVYAEARHNLTQELKQSRIATGKIISRRRRSSIPSLETPDSAHEDTLAEIAGELFNEEIFSISEEDFNTRLMAQLGQEQLAAMDDADGIKKKTST